MSGKEERGQEEEGEERGEPKSQIIMVAFILEIVMTSTLNNQNKQNMEMYPSTHKGIIPVQRMNMTSPE